MTRVAITGAAGLLGRALGGAFGAAGHEVTALTHADVDVGDPDALVAITEARPEIIVNAAAWTDVDGCARDPARAMRINGSGAGHVAALGARLGAVVVQISSNEVFDGDGEDPYREDDTPNPVNPYGASKRAGEEGVARATDDHLIIRTAWLFGPDRGFPDRIRAAANRAYEAGYVLRVVEDEWGNPTPVGPLASGIVDAAERRARGEGPSILHLAGDPPASRLEWATAVLADHPVTIVPMRLADYRRDSVVPPRPVLSMDLARSMSIPRITWDGS